MSQATFYGQDVNPNAKQDYLDEVIEPAYYPDGTGEAHLDKKYVKYWLSPMLDMVEDGRQNFAPQFWGDTAYGILVNQYIGSTDQPFADAIPLSEMKAIVASRTGATDFGHKLNTSRTYTTYCPAKIGYDPVNVGYFPDMVTGIGGTAAVTGGVRDSSFVPYTYLDQRIRLHLYGYGGGIQQTFLFYADGATDNTDSTHSAYTQPPCFIGDGITYPNQASDLHAYLVTSTATVPTGTGGTRERYRTNWVVYSESNNFYRIFPAIDLGLAYGEPTNEPEGDEPEVPIPIPALPALDIGSAGVKLFKAGNFNALINHMWGTGGFYEAVNKLLGDQTPYECIVAFNLFPYGEALADAGSANIHIGNVDTFVTAPRTNQFCAIDFGTYTIQRQFNNALDFAPYTVVELFLPFIGRVKLPTDFVMGKTIGVTYHMDCLTGGCFAYITTTADGVIQCEGGSCLIQLPISAQTASGARQAISSAMGAGAAFATAGGMTSKIGQVGSVMGGIEQAANAIAAKDSYSSFGGMSLANGYLGLSNPVLYIHRPIDATPAGYNNYMGYAASTIANLGSLSGFTQVKEINLGIAGASKEDLQEIEQLLKEGVYL